jgi:hypothetical protein
MNILDRINTRSLVVLILVCGAVFLAIVDPSFRPSYSNLSNIALGGYLAQLLPQSKDK